MKFLSIIALVACLLALSFGYKIDYTNGHNKIHFENNRFLNGQSVNEPKLDEAIQTLSKLGFKPDEANIVEEAKIIEKTGLDQATVEAAQQIATKTTTASEPQLTAEKQHVLNTLAIHQLNTMKTPAMSSASTINLANKLLPKLEDGAAVKTTDSVVPTVGTSAAVSTAGVVPTISHQNPMLAAQQNKAYEKIMSLKKYTPYFKAKYHLGDDFKDALDENAGADDTASQWNVNPLSFKGARSRMQQNQKQQQQYQKIQKQQQTQANDELLSASGYNYNTQNNNNYDNSYNNDNVVPTKQQNYAIKNSNAYQQPPQQQQYNAQPYQAPYQPAPTPAPAPAPAQSYGSSKIGNTDSSDIFITNINENYNNLNNTETEKAIVKSTLGNGNANSNEQKGVTNLKA